MHKVADWALFHSTDFTVLQDVVQAYQAFALPGYPAGWGEERAETVDLGDRDDEYAGRVVPALSAILDPEGTGKLGERLLGVEFAGLEPGGMLAPHVVDRGADMAPRIVMDWHSRPADLMCLAHEAAHAAQILQSAGGQMPPMARETCAFVGELILLDHVRREDARLFPALLAVWHAENASYLGADLAALTQAMGAPETAYDYRMNYPVARLAAVHVFDQRDRDALAALFASGTGGMDHVPLADMASRADALANYLPPFPQAETPAQAAYQSLGAMALLDLDVLEGESERDIESYYTGLLNHLQQQTAFVALRGDRKPVGYATWRVKTGPDRVVLTHQTAPFGNHLSLQRTLKAKLGEASVHAHHVRSARQEQVAW